MSDVESRLKALLYSDDRTVREDVRLTVGHRVAQDLPEIDLVEVATPAALLRELDAAADTYSLIILDGEARPHGGFGLAHQLKEEYADCPPVLLLVARVADAWLATWSNAEAIATYPVDPVRMPQQVAQVLRATQAA